MNTGSNNTTRVLIALLCAAGLSPLFAQQDDEVPTPDLSHIIVRVSESLTFPRFDGHLTYGHSDRGGDDDTQTKTTFHSGTKGRGREAGQ